MRAIIDRSPCGTTGLRIDEDAFPIFADPDRSASAAAAFAAGLTWHANRQLKLVFDFERTSFGGRRRRRRPPGRGRLPRPGADRLLIIRREARPIRPSLSARP
jgi:hypothetical protein